MKKILVIEDSSNMRDLLRWQIETMGFAPISANLGDEGVAKALSEIPDLIILDIMLPGMDGWEVVKEIRNHAVLKDVPVLAATALFHENDLNHCIDAGCTDYIVKPFTFRQLEAKVKQYISIEREL